MEIKRVFYSGSTQLANLNYLKLTNKLFTHIFQSPFKAINHIFIGETFLYEF